MQGVLIRIGEQGQEIARSRAGPDGK